MEHTFSDILGKFSLKNSNFLNTPCRVLSIHGIQNAYGLIFKNYTKYNL